MSRTEQFLPDWSRVRNSAMFYGALSTVFRAGANILLLPVVLELLTGSELAMWWVFIALGGISTLADFGFAQPITRVYSHLWAGARDFDAQGLSAIATSDKPNEERLRQFHGTVGWLYRWLSLLVFFLLATAGTWFIASSTHATLTSERFWMTWFSYILVVAYGFGASYWSFACQGINRVRELQSASLWSGLAYVLIGAALLFVGCGLFAMVVATAARSMISHWLCRNAYQRSVPSKADGSSRPDPTILKKLWPNAWKFGTIALAVYLINNCTVLISKHFLDDATTASYGLTTQIGLFLVSFSTLWLIVKWPHLTMLRSQGRLEEMSVLFARRLALSFGTFILLGLIALLLGNPVLDWRGANARLLPTPVLLAYLAYLGQQLIYAQFANLIFTENVVPFFKVSLFTGFAALALSLILTPRLGAWGLVLGPLLAAQIFNSWYLIWRGLKGQPLTTKQFLFAALRGHAR